MTQAIKSVEPELSSSPIANPARRRWLLGAGAFGSGALLATVATGAWLRHQIEVQSPQRLQIPYTGVHQAGVTTAGTQEAIFIAFDLLAHDRQGLADTFKLLTQRIAFLTRGGGASTDNPHMPPPDSGVLGTVIAPDGLTITVAVGATLFDQRFGLASQRPKHLIHMHSERYCRNHLAARRPGCLASL